MKRLTCSVLTLALTGAACGDDLNGSDSSGIGGATGGASGASGGTAGASGTGSAGMSIDGSAGSGGMAGGDAAGTGTITCAPTEGASMVALPDGYCIDATEVTRTQYQAWLETNPSTDDQTEFCREHNGDFTPSCDWPPGTKGEYPVVCVDWCDAHAYCAGVGKRLCGKIGGGSNDFYSSTSQSSQWFNACSSHGKNSYCYGNSFSVDTCKGYDGPKERTVRVGSMKNCQSSIPGYEGVFDLSGNAWEWEDSCEIDNQLWGWVPQCRVRGGKFKYNGSGGISGIDISCSAGKHSGMLDDSSQYIGFRCCYP